MITKKQEKTIKEMTILYNWRKQTVKGYKTVLADYVNYQSIDIDKLILEAETEEEKINKISKRKIKQRLLNYRIHLQENKKPNTVKIYLARICKIYRHYDITIPELPPVKVVNTETFEDIPTSDEIKKAIIHSRTKMKAIITFIASTGLRRSDVASLTVGDFIKATKEYHDETSNILQIIQQLNKKEYVVPTWFITDIKTGNNHISFSSHESSVYILQMLQERLMKEDVTLDSKLFGITDSTITINFQNLNTKLCFGWKETRRHFHPHALRKFFATTLVSNDVDFLSTEFLIGHSLPSVQRSYYFANPDKLRSKYLRIMPMLTFTMSVNVVDVTSREKRELRELRNYRVESEERIRKLEEMINLIG